MVALLIIGIASVIGSVSLNMVLGWDLSAAAACPGEPAFCDGLHWRTVANYLPAWLVIGQIVVVFGLASPVAAVRM